jgi:hypothetical protein
MDKSPEDVLKPATEKKETGSRPEARKSGKK